MEPRAEFTQARNQLAQWRAWFSTSGNKDVFKQRFLQDLSSQESIAFDAASPLTILVYGRRSEFEDVLTAIRIRGNLVDQLSEELISFDRLEPQHLVSDLITVKSKGDGHYSAISVPPTFRMSAYFAQSLSRIDGMTTAIQGSAWMTDGRKQFLIERLPYWRTWASKRGLRVIPSGFE